MKCGQRSCQTIDIHPVETIPFTINNQFYIPENWLLICFKVEKEIDKYDILKGKGLLTFSCNFQAYSF